MDWIAKVVRKPTMETPKPPPKPEAPPVVPSSVAAALARLVHGR